MQDDNSGSMGGAPAPQKQPPVNPVEPVSNQQINTNEQVVPGQPVTDSQTAPAVSAEQPVTNVVEPSAPAAAPTPTNASTLSPAPATPMNTGVPVAAGNAAGIPEKKKNKNLAIILSIVAVVVIGIVVAVVLLLNGKGGNLSIADMEKYCKDNGFTADTEHEEKDGNSIDAIQCVAGENSDNKISMIQYAVANKPILEIESFDIDSYTSYFNGTLLVDENNYKKIYMSILGQSVYMIVRGNTYIMIGGSNEDMKNVLISLGYPDDKWSDGSETTSNQDFNTNSGYDDEEDSSSLQAMQRDTQRRNDLSRVDTSIVQYQTNNSGKLMAGPSYWEGSETFNCEVGQIACEFVKKYLNNTDENMFVDPDGTPYSVFITENWVDNGDITTSFGNSLSKLVEADDGEYTIGGSSPFDAHVIYIVPGASCSRYTNVVKASSNRNFALLYQLEDDDEAYCIDDL